MYKICKTQQSYQRQRIIEDVLIQMMLKEQFNTIKISELCEIAEIPRKAFYRYFDTKEDVLYAVIDHTLMDFANICGLTVTDKIFTDIDIMVKFYEFWKERSSFIKALENSNCSSLLVERTVFLEMNGVGNVINVHSIKDGLFERNVFAYTGIFSIMLTWLRTNDKTPREMAEITVGIMTKPLFKVEGCS